MLVSATTIRFTPVAALRIMVPASRWALDGVIPIAHSPSDLAGDGATRITLHGTGTLGIHGVIILTTILIGMAHTGTVTGMVIMPEVADTIPMIPTTAVTITGQETPEEVVSLVLQTPVLQELHQMTI